MHFQRAARTDKSVSAIKQIVSLKIQESIMQKINDVNNLLPDDIRLMGCKRVTQSFDAKNYCDARTYSYMMPSFALCPISEVTKESYRATEDVIKLFNSTLKGYEGTHVFHNFTSGKKFKDDSSARVIRYISCSEPFYPFNQREIEFVVVRIKGQSFMMHQIRKMIGLAIAVVKGFATEDHIKRSMEEPYMDIPKAPGLGLMLEEVHFDRYNKRYGGDGQHSPIEWNDENDAIEQFKDEKIYPIVVETEMREKSMLQWLNTLSLHSYGGENRLSFPSLNIKLHYDHCSDEQYNTDELESQKKKPKLDNMNDTSKSEDKVEDSKEIDTSKTTQDTKKLDNN